MARSGCREKTTILRAAAALAVVRLFAGPVVARTAPALEWQVVLPRNGYELLHSGF